MVAVNIDPSHPGITAEKAVSDILRIPFDSDPRTGLTVVRDVGTNASGTGTWHVECQHVDSTDDIPTLYDITSNRPYDFKTIEINAGDVVPPRLPQGTARDGDLGPEVGRSLWMDGDASPAPSKGLSDPLGLLAFLAVLAPSMVRAEPDPRSEAHAVQNPPGNASIAKAAPKKQATETPATRPSISPRGRGILSYEVRAQMVGLFYPTQDYPVIRALARRAPAPPRFHL